MIYTLLVADLLMFASFLFRYTSLPPQIPLFYSQPWGEDQLVDSWFIILLPIIMHVFFFLNIYLYNKLFFPDHFLRRITYLLNIVLTIICTGIFLKIIFYIT